MKDDKLTDVNCNTFGCVSSIVVSSKLSKMTNGKTLEETKAISKKAVAEALDGLPKEKMHCSNLGEQAPSEAIINYEEGKNGKPKPAFKAKKGQNPKRILHVANVMHKILLLKILYELRGKAQVNEDCLHCHKQEKRDTQGAGEENLSS